MASFDDGAESPPPQKATAGQHSSQTMQQMQEKLQGKPEQKYSRLRQWIQNSVDTLRVNANQHPPLAAFLFILLVLSAVPVSVFVGFALVTSGIFLAIALIGFAMVEGFVILTSGGILIAILGTIALFTTATFAFIGMIYLAYRSGRLVTQKLWQKDDYVRRGISSDPDSAELDPGASGETNP